LPPLPTPLPIFPLADVVLFPGVPLPLHIFEPRYRKMVADVLATHKTIAMALLRPGWEADYQGRPPVYPIACAGLLERHQALPDGRSQIVLRGTSRVRIVEEHSGEPYRLATVIPCEERLGDEVQIEAARRRVLAAIGRARDGPAILVTQPEISSDVFVNALSQSLDLAPVERQSLLDCDTILDRYLRLLELMEFKRLSDAFGSGEAKVH
jgi:Lon protease-like protein